ncbi:MAG: NADH-quinone oxidoreductase subunit C [Rhodobacteraceae bacterium]|nr:NADH-quinone oxidoreductase subunit C [Paracoccaceae bacterium]
MQEKDLNDFKRLAAHIRERQADAILSSEVVGGELVASAVAPRLVDLTEFLKLDPKCEFATLIDITAVDFPGREKRFDVVYHFLSMELNQRIRVKVALRENEVIPSITEVHPSANWFEREVFDMYGVLFSGHPDLRRILTDYGFKGHPLRKDFPLTGFTEVRYDEKYKRVVYEPVELVQEFRQFDFMSPWEGAEYSLEGEASDTGK